MAIAGGFLACVLTMASDSGHAETYVIAGLLVLAGIGLRIEAAIIDTAVQLPLLPPSAQTLADASGNDADSANSSSSQTRDRSPQSP